jgi:hypothetical protein
MEVFILFVGLCLSADCTSVDLTYKPEGVFQSNVDCNVRGEFLTKGKPRPKDFSPGSTTYYCEPWTVTPKDSPLSKEGPADPRKHIPRLSE